MQIANHWGDELLQPEMWVRTPDEIKTIFNSIYSKVDFTENEIVSILTLLQYDKKNSHGKVKFVLLEAIGKPVTDIEVPTALFKASFDYYKQ